MKKPTAGTGIAIGIGTGTLIYMLLGDVNYTFAIAGTVGIALELLYSTKRKKKD